MKLTKLVAIAVFLGSVSAGSLLAQSRPGSQPSEFPPASYKGKQYVDSAGCVFIRAGIDGNISWVPRVSRSRTGVCGFKPTFAGQVASTAPAQRSSSAPAPVQITLSNPPVAAAVPAPVAAPAPRRAPAQVARVAPKPAPRVVRQVAKRPAPAVAPVVKTAPVNAKTTRRVAQGTSACPGVSGISGQYLRSSNSRLAVRCGPQTTPIVGARISSAAVPRGTAQPTSRTVAAQPIRVSPQTRIVPRHVAVNRVNTNNVQVPAGFRTVWSDDRLNPNRAEQSLAGHRAMSLVWTSTVPRRLINQADGRDVTASVALVYPFTDFEAQQRDLGQVTIVQRDGQTLKRIIRSARRVVNPEPGQARVSTVQRAPTLSSRSASKVPTKATAKRAAPKGEVAGDGFVQVGSFASASAAQTQAQKVRRMGLPVRVGVLTRGGKTTRLVIAGPFASDARTKSAVSRLRSAGMTAVAR
ncbi:MAG: SPOR domain-containing protein [Sulfitobacter sp.]